MTRSVKRQIACSIGLIGLVGIIHAHWPGNACAQAPAAQSPVAQSPVAQSPVAQTRPSESSLPAYYYTSPSDKLAQGVTAQERAAVPTLPSESSLPGAATLPGAAKAVAAGPLPSESQLPPTDKSPSDVAVPDAQDSLVQLLAASRDRTPWLRLVEAEHTAPIRALELDASGNNLFTAGEDKVVHHWKRMDRAAGGAPGAEWQHHAVYRWQVQRAELGTILCLVSQGDELLIAGAGADGQQGEIVNINTKTDAWLAPLVDAANGPHAPILKMKMVAEIPTRRLISMDQKHGISLWQQDPNQGTWKHRWLRKPDASQKFNYAPVAISSSSNLVAATDAAAWTIDFTDMDSGAITKQLQRNAPPQSPQAFAQALQLAAEHFRSSEGKSYTAAELEPTIRDNSGATVTCLEIAPQDQYVAAGDEMGFLYLWNPQGQLALKAVASFRGFRFQSLAFSRDGRFLAAAANSVKSAESIIHLWKLSAGSVPTLVRELHRPAAIYGIGFTRDAQTLLIGNGRHIEVVHTQPEQPPESIPAREKITFASQVAFAAELPYRWKFSIDGQQTAFDGQSMQWLDTTDIAWNAACDPTQHFAMGEWSLTSQMDAPGAKPQDWIMRGNRRIGRLELDAHYQTQPNSRVQKVAWLKDSTSEVAAIAVSLSGQNDIWVFALPSGGQNTCPLKRVFGGHEGPVLSLDSAPDGRYLISCAQDCTIRIWPLTGIDALRLEPPGESSAPRSNWGFDFTIADGQVLAERPYFTSPLFIKGMRAGDRLREISYETHQADGTLRRTTMVQPAEIVDFLNQPRYDVQVRFIFERAGVEVPGFQSYAHWREIASQVIAADREWAVWTPSGYYDASFNGNSLFGWQINRGLEKEPDFYRADRFQAVLERPDLLRHLLTAGSIEQAAELVGNQRLRFGDVLQNALAVQPQVKILSPAAGQVLIGPQAVIRAAVVIGSGQQLASAKAFVSGVVATHMKQDGITTLEDGSQRIELSWQGHLPSDKDLQLQVLCATRDKLVGADTLRLTHQQDPNSRRKPKLFLLTAGVSQYRDSRIPSLTSGATNAQAIMQTLLAQARSIYDVMPLSLTDSSVTPNVWRSTTSLLDDQLDNIQPDDLIVLFVSGHGLVDQSTNQYYFVTANARYSDIVRQNYRDCLSFNELMSWVDVPCRKIAILDTCHSGAIQPLASDHLKTAVRNLQGDMVLTLTASEGNQLAAEYRGAQASLFTAALQETLQGFQDTNRNGALDWSELVQQVRSQVTRQSLVGSVAQFPTAGPKDLLDVIELPLVRRSPQAAALSTSPAYVVSHRKAP